MSDFTILQGNTSPSLEVYADIMTDVTGWTCSMTLTAPDGTKAIDRAVTDTTQDLTKFVAFLTEAETDALAVETYVWAITLTNPSFNPAFEAVELHNIMIEPPAGSAASLLLVRGENSFGTYEELLNISTRMNPLSGVRAVSRNRFKSALVEAWLNIGALSVNFTRGTATTRYFSASILDALSEQERYVLKSAQIKEADFILSTPDAVRFNHIKSQTVGESKTVWRNNRDVTISPHVMRLMEPWIMPGQNHVAMIHV